LASSKTAYYNWVSPRLPFTNFFIFPLFTDFYFIITEWATNTDLYHLASMLFMTFPPPFSAFFDIFLNSFWCYSCWGMHLYVV